MTSTPTRPCSLVLRAMFPFCLLASSLTVACGDGTGQTADEAQQESALDAYGQQRASGTAPSCDDDSDGSDDDDDVDVDVDDDVDVDVDGDGDGDGDGEDTVPDNESDADAGIDPGTVDEEPAPEDDTTTIGAGGIVDQTIVVRTGELFDGKGKRFIAGSSLGDGSQSEAQKPVFKLEDGATLTNVVLGAPAADGIHTYGNVNLKNIVWEDIGEDALTIKASGTVVLDGGSAANGEDKVFQINAASTFRVSNFKAISAGKFIRQNGGTQFQVNVFIDRCDISQMKEAIFRTDSSVSTVSMTNTRFSKIGKALFLGVNPKLIKTANNTEY